MEEENWRQEVNAFLGMVDVVLWAACRVLSADTSCQELPSMQVFEGQIQRLLHEMSEEAVADWYGGQLAQGHRDKELVLAGLCSLYTENAPLVARVVCFKRDSAPSQRVRFVELLQAAFLSATGQLVWSAEDEQEREVHDLLCVLCARRWKETE